MTITSVRYINAAQTFCEAVIDDVTYQQVGPGGPIGEQIVAWIAAGNTPAPYVVPQPPTPLTPQQRLAVTGLTVDELKTLLGL